MREAAVLLAYVAVGIAVTWPRLAYLAGRLPATPDAGGYVWDFWWMARQVTHLGDPWFTRYLAAPVGAALGYHTLMPLPGLAMTPITLLFGPSASYNLLSALSPGLLAYAMRRAAMLWMPTGVGAYAAGAFFGFSPILSWRSWYEVNLAVGAIFFPVALAAAVRLRRSPTPRRALILGAVVGGAVLTDQECAAMTAMLVVPVLLPWLVRHRDWARVMLALTACAAAAVTASPQIAAMAQQTMTGGTGSTGSILASDYVYAGAGLEQLFAPSPRLAAMGLPRLALSYYRGGPLSEVVVGYGVTLSALAVLGLILAWRRRGTRALAAFWLGCTALSLGSALWIGKRYYVPLPENWHGVRVSQLMPFTWFVQLPGMSSFREADRFTELALVGAALLAGRAVAWLFGHARPALVVVAALATLETGWSGNPPLGTGSIPAMPTATSALSGPIAADHSNSIVVGVPFGIRGGLPVLGWAFPPQTLVMATAQGHPLADGFISRIPYLTRRGIREIPFYVSLLRAQAGLWPLPPGAVAAARRSARLYRIEWVVDWMWRNGAVTRFLVATGFRPRYRADGAWVYRLPAPAR